MIVISKKGVYYKVYYDYYLSDRQISEFLRKNKLRFLQDLGKGLSFDHCILCVRAYD